jgi:PAS domain S-box-containing protein
MPLLERLSGFALEPILLKTTTDLIERLGNPCVLVDKRERIASANQPFGELFGLAPAQLVGLPLFAVADGLFDRPQIRGLASGGASWQEVQDLELDLAVPGLGRRMVSLTTVRIQADWFDAGVTLLTFQDNTRRSLLAEERAALVTAIDQATNLIAVTDTKGSLVYANPAFARLVDVPAAQLIGCDATQVLSKRLAPIRSDDIACLLCPDGWSGACTAVGKGGTTHLLDVVAAPVLSARGRVRGHVIVGLDVTNERRAEEELRRELADRAAVARTLGNLRSAASVDETSAQLCAEIRKHPGLDAAAVLVTWGRSRAVPVAVVPAGLGVQPRRPMPAAVGRYLRQRSMAGPWVEPCHGAKASVYSRALAPLGLSAVASLPIVGAEGQVGVLVVGTAKGGTAALLRRMPSLIEFGALATALLADPLAARQAAAANQRELWDLIGARAFDPVFQPIVELSSGAVVGYEALTRFHDNTDPAERFAAAREAGLGRVLEQATMQAALDEAVALPEKAWLALNVSADLALHGTRLRRLISDQTRPLVLEITEHEPVADPAAIRGAVVRLGDQLRTLRIAVDDAGAGFNGLRFILELAPDLIKLDRTLIADIEKDPAKQALVVGMRHFANKLGAQLVAEGVETEAALATLNTLGVTYGQGHLLGRPEAATHWLQPTYQQAERIPAKQAAEQKELFG